MTHRNEKMLRASYDAFGRGDANPLMSALAEDIKWYVSGRSPLAGEYSGKAEVLGFFGKMMEFYQGTLKQQVLDILANDAHGMVLTREAAQYKEKSVEFRSVHVWEISNGKLVEFHVYYDDAYHNFWS